MELFERTARLSQAGGFSFMGLPGKPFWCREDDLGNLALTMISVWLSEPNGLGRPSF